MRGASLRTCVPSPQHLSGSQAVARAWTSPTSPPQPFHPTCRRRIPAVALYCTWAVCTSQPPHLNTMPGPRSTNYESDSSDLDTVLLLSKLLDQRGAVLPSSIASATLSRLARQTPKLAAAPRSTLGSVARRSEVCRCASRLLLRHPRRCPCSTMTRRSRHDRDGVPSLVQAPVSLL